MPDRSSPSAKLASPNAGDAQGREVGRIILGERVFIVALAPEFPHPSMRGEVSRFELMGRDLVVLDMADRRRAGPPEAVDDVASRLTGRELEIAVLVAQGCATKHIAYRLQISEWTVATYLRRIFAKLDVYSRAQMVYRCAPLIDRIADIRASAREGRPATSAAPGDKANRRSASVVALSNKKRGEASVPEFAGAHKGRH
jgi:DNA-binding CsgD family transcriptional regulator